MTGVVCVCVAACLRIVRDRAASSSPSGVLGQQQQPAVQPLSTAAAVGNVRNQLNKPVSAQSHTSSQPATGHGRCNGPTNSHRNIKVRFMPVSSRLCWLINSALSKLVIALTPLKLSFVI